MFCSPFSEISRFPYPFYRGEMLVAQFQFGGCSQYRGHIMYSTNVYIQYCTVLVVLYVSYSMHRDTTYVHVYHINFLYMPQSRTLMENDPK